MNNFYFLLSTLLKRVKIIYLLIPTLSFSQVGTLNAFDNRDISSLYINTKSEKEILLGEPYYTPLINGYRYNAQIDKIVDSLNNILYVDKIKLGELNFIKKEYYKRWSKKKSIGYLIENKNGDYVRVQKKINSNYNPRLNTDSNKKFEERITYFRLIDNKIKQIKKNEDSFFHYYLFVGLNSSQLNIYSNQDFAYRNSTYYGLGLTFPLKSKFSFKSNVLYSKNGNKKWYTTENETGREKIVYNTLGLELLVNKKFNFFNFFTGLRTDYAAKRERILLSRKWYGFSFRDDYTKLDNTIIKFNPLSVTFGFSFEVLESIEFEIKNVLSLSNLSANSTNSIKLFAIQNGFVYIF